MKRTPLVLAGLVCVPLLLAGCGARSVAYSPPEPVSAHAGTNAQAATRRVVDHVLTAAPLPAGARDASAAEAKGKQAQSTPAEDPHLVAAHHVYVVPMGLNDATSWFTAHVPAGLTFSGTSGASGSDGVTSNGVEFDGRHTRLYGDLEEQVGVFPLDASHSVVRIDAMADWLIRRSRAEHVPHQVTAVIGVRVTRNPASVRHFRLTGSAVHRLAHLLNRERPVEIFGLINCPMDTGAHDRLSFLGAGRDLVFHLDPSGCSFINVTADGTRQPTLGGGSGVDQLLAQLLARR